LLETQVQEISALEANVAGLQARLSAMMAGKESLRDSLAQRERVLEELQAQLASRWAGFARVLSS
jgi:chromosome segregation ATPase